MKKCPFCKAEIADDARFCLYCMQPLNEKEEIPPLSGKPLRWLPAVAFLLIAVVITAVLIFKKPPAATGDQSLAASQSERPSANQATFPDESTDATTQTTQPGNSVTEPHTPTASEAPDTAEPQTPNAPEEPETEVVYIYRIAGAGDDYNAHYQNPGNDIVITGVAQPSADGVYDIPAYIDGNKVIAITANAFTGSDAQVVYIPDTIKAIWNYAFAGCELTDVYFRGDAIYAESSAFSNKFTLHCSAACHNRDFRYYKNNAVSYGATWEEWDGTK